MNTTTSSTHRAPAFAHRPSNRVTRRANGQYRGFTRSNSPRVAPFDWGLFAEAKPWYLKGGYSPDGASWVCPVADCTFGIFGLNSDSDDYGDPVWGHLYNEHPKFGAGVDEHGRPVA